MLEDFDLLLEQFSVFLRGESGVACGNAKNTQLYQSRECLFTLK